MSKKDKPAPTQTTEKGLEIPIPSREDWDATLSKLIKPARAGESDADAADKTDES